jgi:hypothetical protein
MRTIPFWCISEWRGNEQIHDALCSLARIVYEMRAFQNESLEGPARFMLQRPGAVHSGVRSVRGLAELYLNWLDPTTWDDRFASLIVYEMRAFLKFEASKVQCGFCCCVRVQSTAENGASERRCGAREDGLHPGRCSRYVCARPPEAPRLRKSLL